MIRIYKNEDAYDQMIRIMRTSSEIIFECSLCFKSVELNTFLCICTARPTVYINFNVTDG